MPEGSPGGSAPPPAQSLSFLPFFRDSLFFLPRSPWPFFTFSPPTSAIPPFLEFNCVMLAMPKTFAVVPDSLSDPPLTLATFLFYLKISPPAPAVQELSFSARPAAGNSNDLCRSCSLGRFLVPPLSTLSPPRPNSERALRGETRNCPFCSRRTLPAIHFFSRVTPCSSAVFREVDAISCR